MRGTPGQPASLRRESLTRSFRLLNEARAADERASVSKMTAPNTSGGGMSSAAPPSAAQVRLLAKRPRRCFTTEEDLVILREVTASKPFNDDLQWIHVIENLKRVLGRELTLRSLKDRVDLLIGYWRQEDTRNLRKSGTEEQYAEKEQILQDLSDYIRSINYVPIVAPRSSNSTGRKRSHAAASSLATPPEQLRADEDQAEKEMKHSFCPACRLYWFV
ncbi:uncharacterized protein LOC125760283 [Rhipicephalus sanguineus]|uniref:uncharacterized protein LOC125760283 n=1 Tax=Rhipicephalus sanguineus TaxID=34632 RepID=UPI0020C5A7E1|nr:uncharacterized protein LOC125760283 [Rhipicephalus sanguineus]